MTDWQPNYEDGRIYSGPVIDRGILGEDDVPEFYSSKTPFFYVAKIGPLPVGFGHYRNDIVQPPAETKWLYEWHEERGGWLFMGAR